MKQNRAQGGFTLLELLVSMAVLVPLVAAVASTAGVVGSSIDANNQTSEVLSMNRAVMERMGQLMRPAVLSSFKVRALQSDVDDYQAIADAELLLNPLAITYVPNLGDWIPPKTPPIPRQNLQFQCAEGTLSMNADALTPVREFETLLEPGELDNGLDDDGDGLVDERQLVFVYDGTRLVICDEIERCEFLFLGKEVQVTLALAKRDKSGRVHRGTFVHRFFPRNN